ncbi:hypothetical protein BEP19_15785 [Ammoniphilus oxalaticus]|uniref:Holin n=1 Tax=Ammoniphilus oxalaticus TaxID=66863 RepID=A0A419SDH9_9BACL|nr:hypothetical protein [Ammoniphilus oxalaticus]RKD21131.1 hypothetical protein BEP19_15785 [Ammoniphilus oxalaticus]
MFEIYDVAIIPLIIGLIELCKRVGVPIKLSPVIALLLGLAAGIFYIGADVKEGIIVGLMLGLSATGLYSGAKNVTEKKKHNKSEDHGVY